MKKFKKDNKMVGGIYWTMWLTPLFYLFVTFKSTKIIWEKLEAKYGANDAEKKKYVVSEWLCFQIIDDKSIMGHVHV